MQVAIIVRGLEGIKKLEGWSAPLLLAGGALLLGWAIVRGGGLGHILSESTRLQTNHVPFWQIFPAALTANVGYWATLSLNIPDFTRYARSQRSQALGQALGLPATMTAFAFIGVAVTSATVVIFGEAIWDPVALIARIGNAPVIIFGALVILLAQLTTNMAANVVSPANDFSSLAPRRISYVTGGLITAAIGILMMPWKLYADASAYIFTWLLGYSSLMGAIGGVLIADYWLLRRRQLSLPDLFAPDGRYAYTNGVNRRAMWALVLAILPVVPGFVRAATTPGGTVRRSDLPRHALYLRLVRHLHPERRALPRVQSKDVVGAGSSDPRAEQVACADDTSRQKRGRHAHVRVEALDLLIGVALRQRVAHDAVVVQVYEPVLRHAAPRVHVGFHVAVEVDRRIRHLDDEQHVARPGMRRRVEVCTRPQQHDVGLGLGVKAESDRTLNADNRLVAGHARDKGTGRPIDTRRMPRSDRRHRQHVAVDELDAVAGGQDARFSHALVFVGCEAAVADGHGHRQRSILALPREPGACRAGFRA